MEDSEEVSEEEVVSVETEVVIEVASEVVTEETGVVTEVATEVEAEDEVDTTTIMTKIKEKTKQYMYTHTALSVTFFCFQLSLLLRFKLILLDLLYISYFFNLTRVQ